MTIGNEDSFGCIDLALKYANSGSAVEGPIYVGCRFLNDTLLGRHSSKEVSSNLEPSRKDLKDGRLQWKDVNRTPMEHYPEKTLLTSQSNDTAEESQSLRRSNESSFMWRHINESYLMHRTNESSHLRHSNVASHLQPDKASQPRLNYVTKCCPSEQGFDLRRHRCGEQVVVVGQPSDRSFPASRRIRNSDSMLVASDLEIRVFDTAKRFCEKGANAMLEKPEVILNNGSLLIKRHFGYKMIEYECVARNETDLIAIVCNKDEDAADRRYSFKSEIPESVEQPFWRPKCCSLNEVFDVNAKSCKVVQRLPSFLNLNRMESTSKELAYISSSNIALITLICLPRKTRFLDLRRINYTLVNNGNLLLTTSEAAASSTIPPEEFCFENLISGTNVTKLFKFC